jgi:Mlc titration factor MtfA (ptsG expression regulator)
MYPILGILIIIGVLFLLLRERKELRRKKLRALPVSPEWKRILERNLPIYRGLPGQLKEELHGHIQVLLHEKNFEGCGGLDLTDEIKVTVAAQACILLLNRKPNYYPKLSSILIYPSAFIAKNVMKQDGNIVDEEVRLGESWRTGAVVLSWDDVLHGALDAEDGQNVVLHEFAHQLDQEDGVPDGTPMLEKRSRYISWARILSNEFRLLQKRASQGTNTVIDHYGANDPAEFFAVATEAFFEKPLQLKLKHPELYEQLKIYYQLDPATWLPE